MYLFPSHDQIQRACLHAWDALSLEVGTPFNQNEVSVFLKSLLLEGLESDKRQSHDSLSRRLDRLLSDLLCVKEYNVELPVLSGITWDAILAMLPDSLYRQRLIHRAMEARLSEALAPELCLNIGAENRQSLSTALPGSWNHAVIFDSPLFFVNEFYPLAVDAFVYDSEHNGQQRINVIGAHSDWLTTDGKLKRLLYVDFHQGRLIETDVDQPIQPDSVHLLCLGDNEQEKHKIISERISVFQLNSFTASALADDKAKTLVGWSALGLEIPGYQIIPPGDFLQAFQFLNTFNEIIVKPNSATEGHLVAFFQLNDPQIKEKLKTHLKQCWRLGDAMVQQRRDGIAFKDACSSKFHSLALRFNLSVDRDGCINLDSGYAQIGQQACSVASCGQGGRIIPIDEALSNLSSRTDSSNQSICLNLNDWNRIQEQAKHAASLFKGLMLMGVDVLLDHDRQGRIVPIFLEANPRPAGLSHSRLFNDGSYLTGKPGVSLSLWGNIASFPRSAWECRNYMP